MQVIDGANATGIIDDSTGLLVEGYAVLERDKNKTRKQKHILQKATHGYTEKETRRRRELKTTYHTRFLSRSYSGRMR